MMHVVKVVWEGVGGIEGETVMWPVMLSQGFYHTAVCSCSMHPRRHRRRPHHPPRHTPPHRHPGGRHPAHMRGGGTWGWVLAWAHGAASTTCSRWHWQGVWHSTRESSNERQPHSCTPTTRPAYSGGTPSSSSSSSSPSASPCMAGMR